MLILSLMLTIASGLLVADEIDDKMMQLRQIEKQIDIIQQKAKQAEQKKKKAQSDITTTQKSKIQTDEAVAQLKRKEDVVQDSLQAANERVRTNEEKINDLKKLANNEFLRLFYIDMQDKYVVKETRSKFLLSMLISLTAKSISDWSEFHKILVLNQEDRRNEYYRVRNTRVREVKKSEQYKKKIQTLTKQTTQLEKERKSYEQQVAKLKKDASELENLISKLIKETDKTDRTYLFSGKRIPWPVRGQILREFGEESRGNNTSIINNGIDIGVPEGTNVISIDAGEVVFSDRYGGQGKLIIIDHKNGFFSVYAYNSELMVPRGSKVTKGQVIAKSGKTGSAIQPSLHFELRKDGRAVNPMNYLE